MKFLVPNYSCFQNPWLGDYCPQIPVLSVLCPQLKLLNPPYPKKIPGYATVHNHLHGPQTFISLCRSSPPAPHGIRSLTAVHTAAHYWYLSWARWIPKTLSHLFFLKSTVIFSPHLRLSLPSGIFPSGSHFRRSKVPLPNSCNGEPFPNPVISPILLLQDLF